MSPKKNDQTKMGWFSKSHPISLAREMKLTKIPLSRMAKNLRLYEIHAFLNPFSFQVLKNEKFKLWMVFINSSYIPEINAIVPPDTPGTTSAAPIAIPFKNKKRCCTVLFSFIEGKFCPKIKKFIGKYFRNYLLNFEPQAFHKLWEIILQVLTCIPNQVLKHFLNESFLLWCRLGNNKAR